MERNNGQRVVIAGAGLAGLAAAASAARAGARVLILDEKSPGGRARTDQQDGFRFNRGPHAIYLGGLGPEVTAACLDLGVRHARTHVTFGLDEPLYLSPHAPGGNLAPNGMGMVHVARYGATTAAADRARLEEFARTAGIADGDIATARFLPNMTV